MEKPNGVSRFVKIVLDIADYVDESAEKERTMFLDGLGYGYLSLSGYLRKGVCDIAEMQMNYANAKCDLRIAKESEKDARQFLEYIFGDENIDEISEELKHELKSFVNGFYQTR